MKKQKHILLIILFLALANFVFAENAKCDAQKLVPVKFRQSGQAVKNLQACLIKIGFKIPSGATGYYGLQTVKAVKEFYKNWYGNWHGYSIGKSGIKKLKELASFNFISKKIEFKKFKSKNEFKNYLFLIDKEQAYLREISLQIIPHPYIFMAPFRSESLILEAPKSAERIAETTVQVKGIDEPDIVKTDGINIYFSQDYPKLKTQIIKAFPVDELKFISSIDKSGELLLLRDKKILIIFSGNKILGYDISTPENPQEKWRLTLKNGSLIGARLYKGKIYLAFKKWLDYNEPCPVEALSINNKDITIDCHEIYYPSIIIPVDVLFNVIAINPINGTIENKISFLGSIKDSVFYMSPNNIYITYSFNESISKFLIDFFAQGEDLLPKRIIEKIEKLKNYDISDGAKIVEIENILENYKKTLKTDERLRLENELTNRLRNFYSLNKRDIEKTSIVKINIEKFEISSIGSIPGYPLNQFSLDEYQDNLRIATTIGERGSRFGRIWIQGIESLNDVYILDKNLKILSSVRDLGKGERIYSVRFIEDKGYVVTFRETDPFYVLDLKDPQNPKLTGELKIPGYSSYLHPINKDKILGIGKENQNVKISLFDVSYPENPIEKDKYILQENWSEVLTNFHAFLLDNKHQIFFIPAYQGGYIFSYKDDKLSLLKTISDFDVKRAIYLDDFLYILSLNRIVVLDENNWEIIKELSFD